jgi:hypothetical protein
MSPRKRLVVVAAALAAAGALAVWLFLGPLSPSRRLAAAISRATGMPCTVGSVRPADEGFEIRELALGAEPGPRLEIDRLLATGSLAGRELRTLSVSDGRARLALPGLPAVRLTNVDVSAGNLGALAGEADGQAALAVSGDCMDLNPILKERGKLRFLRGRFTLSCTMGRPGSAPLDVPIKVVLTDFHVQSLKRRYEGEVGSYTASVLLTGSLRDPKIDARELAPILDGFDLSTPKSR